MANTISVECISLEWAEIKQLQAYLKTQTNISGIWETETALDSGKPVPLPRRQFVVACSSQVAARVTAEVFAELVRVHIDTFLSKKEASDINVTIRLDGNRRSLVEIKKTEPNVNKLNLNESAQVAWKRRGKLITFVQQGGGGSLENRQKSFP